MSYHDADADSDADSYRHDRGDDDVALQETLNIPQLIVFLLFTALAVRWLFSRSFGRRDGAPGGGGGDAASSTGVAGRNAAAAARRRLDERSIEQIQAMFPQYNRRDIYWDLMRTGGSVQATTERILAGRGLDAPPPFFQPPLAPAGSATTSQAGVSSSSSASTGPATNRSTRPNLITRYNLSSKIAAADGSTESSPAEEAKANGAIAADGRGVGTSRPAASKRFEQQAWSQNKQERHATLQRRREEMILAARRRLMEKERSDNTSPSAPPPPPESSSSQPPWQAPSDLSSPSTAAATGLRKGTRKGKEVAR